MDTLKRFWAWWKGVAQRIGDFQARLLLTLFYYIIFAPFGLIIRAFSDPLMIKQRNPKSMWMDKHLPDATLENARRQF
jgi:hypothetical protein